jgi:hypothetical protein
MITSTGRTLLVFLFAAGTWVVFATAPHAQTVAARQAGKDVPAGMQQMVGTWDVQQRMWPGLGAEPKPLPPAIARRQLIGTFLQEVMEPAKKSAKDSFTRTAYFNYNAVSQQYEYFSLDTRAPQMMNERSDKTQDPAGASQGEVKLMGSTFVAPQWGPDTNVTFQYRLTVGRVQDDRQIVQLFLTPKTAANDAKEFLAFEYVYTRQPTHPPRH